MSHLGNEDLELEKKLMTELSGILLWSIEGWQRLQERRRFTQPASGAELLRQLGELASPIKAFVSSCCSLGQDKRVAKSSLYTAWKAWCERNECKPGTDGVFARNLYAAYTAVHAERCRIEGGERDWFYLGIDLI